MRYSFPVLSAHLALLCVTQATYRDITVVKDVGVQVSIEIVIKETGVGGETCFGQVVLLRHLFKGSISLIDIEIIVVVVSFQVSGVADIDV